MFNKSDDETLCVFFSNIVWHRVLHHSDIGLSLTCPLCLSLGGGGIKDQFIRLFYITGTLH
jgi:hypothetical protein